MSDLVKYEVKDSIAHIVLNKPDKLNSLSSEMVKAILEILRQAEESVDVRVIILSSEGRSFCAGGDLDTLKTLNDSIEIANWMKQASSVTEAIMNINKFVVSAVHGHAAGAGFSLALASDFIVADRSAKFSLSFKNVGLIPDLGLMKLLSERVSLPIVKEWIVSGQTISADEGYKRGIINRITDKPVVEEAILFSKSIVEGPPISNQYVKYLLNRIGSIDYETALFQENLIQSLLLQSKDHKEGLAAFFEKRQPTYIGK
ncbi:enoyl-CoA hydratase/isomerase family protein [Peribacillus frigoritolerans]|uniref:enoyl-CoA hydratase/isomerase family protein n=1 Tax=Peribacillus frigoritolerans TaxID=450367 RepID=UPI0038720095